MKKKTRLRREKREASSTSVLIFNFRFLVNICMSELLINFNHNYKYGHRLLSSENNLVKCKSFSRLFDS